MRFNCPKCDVDISDSYQPDEPDVGIVGGWYCEACDEGFAEWEYPYEPLEDDVPLPTISESEPQHTRCPAHPDAIPEMGFGLAGGGYGPYSYCPQCGHIIHKTRDYE